MHASLGRWKNLPLSLFSVFRTGKKSAIVWIVLLIIALPTAWFFLTLPDISVLEEYRPLESIQIFDRYDRLVTTIEGDEDRVFVPLNRVAADMQKAILSAEDRKFYSHGGVNLFSMCRALLANIFAGKVVEGGSTISQQLVKNVFFSSKDRSFWRKFKEVILAVELERRYSKDRILEMYLNQIYFGKGAFGIERAAHRYFAKSASSLGPSEAAYLAGLVKAPSVLSDAENRERAVARKNQILATMLKDGYISKEQYAVACSSRLRFKSSETPLQKHPYYVSHILKILKGQLTPEQLQNFGLRVYTYLEPSAQSSAEKILGRGIRNAPIGISQGALVSLDTTDGGVIAMVGGVGPYQQNQWNRATSPHTAGSIFKPFVYLAAFERGVLTPASLIEDSPVTFREPFSKGYQPKNFDGKYLGSLTVQEALAQSRNTCAVQVAHKVGINNVIDVARRAGITSKLDRNLTLALGSSAVSPLEIAAAYGTFVRNGVYVKPQFIRRIEDTNGALLKEFNPETESEPVLNPRATSQLMSCLESVVTSGTGTKAQIGDIPIVGKTGTADGGTDIWFVGSTPSTVTAVWGGADKPVPLKNDSVTGGGIMASIWRDYNRSYLASLPNDGQAVAASFASYEPEDIPREIVRTRNDRLDNIADWVSSRESALSPEFEQDSSKSISADRHENEPRGISALRPSRFRQPKAKPADRREQRMDDIHEWIKARYEDNSETNEDME